MKTHFIQLFKFLFLLWVLSSSCSLLKEPSPFDEIDRYEPILKQFLVENEFCTIEDSIHIGLERFTKQLDRNQSYEGIKWIDIPNDVCTQFREDSVYASIWKVDSQMIYIGALLDEGEEPHGEPVLDIDMTIDTNCIYFQTLKNNFDSLQSMLQDVTILRYDEVDVPVYRLMINLEKRRDIDYRDPMLVRMIIVELIYGYMDFYCNLNRRVEN